MNSEIKKNQGNIEYYLKNKKKILKGFNSLVKVAKKTEFSDLDASTIDIIIQKAQIELEKLLSKLPFVGGDKSPFTPLMIQSAMTIAFYKASTSLKLSERELGKFIYQVAALHAQSISTIKKWINRKIIFSKKGKNYWKTWLRETQKREYPENWAGVFIESDNNSFDYGFDFTECGMIKLAQEENVEEIVPYACLCDYARMRAFGIGFKRTKTLIAGEDSCDFRFVKGCETPRGWPPEDLEENKIFYANLKQKS